MTAQHQLEKAVVIATVEAASRLCASIRSSQSLGTLHKWDASPVTIADFAAQAVMCQHLHQAFPQDSIVAEEEATELRRSTSTALLDTVTDWVRSSLPEATPTQVCDWIDLGRGSVGKRFWTLDPIDGTKGFLRGDQYAVALALIEDGVVQLGGLGCPALAVPGWPPGILVVAQRGVPGIELRSLVTGETRRLNPDSSAVKYRLAESIEAGHGDPVRQRSIAQQLGCQETPLKMDSQAKYATIALGEAALYMRLPWIHRPDYQENIWDHAAGAIIIEAMGGTVTDMHGNPLQFDRGRHLIENSGIIASRGLDHDRVIAALQAT